MSGHWARGYLGLAGADQNGGNGGGGVLIIEEGVTTWQQVYDALAAGTPVVVPYVEDGAHVYFDYIYAATITPEKACIYTVGTDMSTGDPYMVAESADGALAYYEGD